ncbi:hypothetical protein FOZ60_012702 [Perkinsus olseni]|uniref:DUF7047 domain-containing protein n=1 Tax=Perkinsus olseni TaxID=32597 RepID=A0A7J6NAW4_PEROL|nr:hypothetical protein FOZ60_012702 [Perkinsus olseni]
MPSCRVEATISAGGLSVVAVSLDAPDCRAVRHPISQGSDRFYWEVAWKWKDSQPPQGRISCPEEYGSICDLPEHHFQSLRDELTAWFQKGWIVVVPPLEYHKMKCVLPLVLAFSAHKSTVLRPCHDFSVLNRYCVASSDEDAAVCNVSLRSWREFSEGTVLDIKKAYLSLRVEESLTWCQCFRVPTDCINDPSISCDTGYIYLRLCRCGFGQLSSPRLLKMVTDYCLRKENIKKYFDDIFVPMCKGVSASKHQSDVDRVRALLAQEDLYTKEPTSIQDSRVLGLQISKVGDELFWRRRVDITDFLEFDDRICSDEAVTYQDCSSFLGQLSSLLPVLSWLRPVTALGKRIVGSAAGTTKSSWRRLANESSKRFCRYICTLLRKLGDPGRGVWAVPPRSEALHSMKFIALLMPLNWH